MKQLLCWWYAVIKQGFDLPSNTVFLFKHALDLPLKFNINTKSQPKQTRIFFKYKLKSNYRFLYKKKTIRSHRVVVPGNIERRRQACIVLLDPCCTFSSSFSKPQLTWLLFQAEQRTDGWAKWPEQTSSLWRQATGGALTGSLKKEQTSERPKWVVKVERPSQ